MAMHKYEDISEKGYARAEDESLGGKEKFWLRADNDVRWLFKIGRDDHENWSEVLAADICQALHIPHAEYKLAVYNGQPGVISKDFVRLSPQGETRDFTSRDSTCLLANFLEICGKDILENIAPPIADRFQQLTLTISRKEMIQAMRHIEMAAFMVWFHQEAAKEKTDFFIRDPNFPKSEYSLLHYFVGYLMLDVFIANRDRHQENWGYIEGLSGGNEKCCAPTYDHASSFAKGSDEKKEALMNNKNGFGVKDFCRRAYTPFVNFAGKKLTTLEVFAFVNAYCPKEAEYWKRRLRRCSMEKVFIPLVHRFPDDVMSPITKDFVIEMLRFNKDRILYL